jgi:hypothetical protein
MKKLLIFILLICSLNAAAATYYVSSSDGSDSDSGLTEALAWATLTKINATTFAAGDSILFKRGDTFRGGISQNEDGTNSDWIVYGAYGTGAKPLILGAKDLSATGDWELHSGNVWKTTATLGTIQDDISNLIFNNEAYCGYKKKSIDSLNAAHKFYYNRTDDLLYLYATSNPGTFYTHIEAAGNYDVAQGLLYWITSSYIKVKDLDVRYSSAAGIETHTGNCITIEDCDVSYIGGEWLVVDDASLTRLGNGISMVQTNDSIIVRRCNVSQCFDAGISPQYWSASSMTNMWIYSNIITNCWYSYETWCGAISTLTNIHFYNNTCVAAGDCWSGSTLQRPDADGASHVLIHTLAGTVSNITVRNNILKDSEHFGFKVNDNIAKLTSDYNLIFCDTIAYANETDKYTTLAAWVAAVSQDANSVSGDPLFTSATDFHLLSGSPAIDAGTDLDLTTDYYGSTIGTLPDIGAIEYGSRYVINNGKFSINNGNLVVITR